MSDRTRGSVRTGTRGSDEGSTKDPAKDGGGGARPGSASSTRSIPTTGTSRAQSAAAGGTPVPPSSSAPRPARGGAAGPATGSAPAAPRTGSGPAAPGTPAAAPAASGTPAAVAQAPSPGTTAAAPPAAPAAAAVAAPAAAGSRERAAAGSPARGPAPVPGRGPRRARLQLRHIDTWSGFKISLVLSIALFFIWMVAVGVLYGVLSGLGVFDTLNDLFGQLGTASGSDVGGSVITPGVVFGGAAVVGAINIVLLTLLGTIATFIYNLCSDLVGGLEVTLSERD